MADVEQPEGEPQGRHVTYCGGTRLISHLSSNLDPKGAQYLTMCLQFAPSPLRYASTP